MSDPIEDSRKKCKYEKSNPDPDKHEEVQSVEFLLPRDVEGDDEDNDAGNDEKNL